MAGAASSAPDRTSHSHGWVFARARAERDAHMAWVQRTAPLLAAEVWADPRATFAALDRMMREHLEYLADMPLGSFGDGA